MSQSDEEVRYEIEERRHREILRCLERIAKLLLAQSLTTGGTIRTEPLPEETAPMVAPGVDTRRAFYDRETPPDNRFAP